MTQRNLFLINAFILFGSYLLLAIFWENIPEAIPMNMGVQSSPRAFMAKPMLFIPLAILTFSSWSLFALRNRAENFSYPVLIHQGNKAAQEKIAKGMLASVSVQIALLIFLMVLRAIVPAERGSINSLMIGALACLFIQVGVSVVRSRKAR